MTSPALAHQKAVRVLVVDDSATARSVLSRSLAADPQIEVVGVARDGVEALDRVKTLRPDVVTLDVEMPGLDGLETLARIMRECPTPVVMVSTHTRHGADVTVRALELGASTSC
ncbi:MAG TPA: response regulator [Dehalococcoidia bacterium]|nr:response regulator [Dehalococcoidia bacterium]